MEDVILFLNKGGVIVYILLFLNIIGFSLIFWKLIILKSVTKNSKKYSDLILLKLKIEKNNTQNIIQNEISQQISEFENGLLAIKIIASIAPLLGLLGTVIGVSSSFDKISQFGLGDPSVFSSGISVALTTTIAGLIVSIPHFIAYNYFSRQIDKIELNIEQDLLNTK